MQTSKSTTAMLTALILAAVGATALAADTEVKREETQIQVEQLRPDVWITAKVKSKLLADSFLLGMDIRVTSYLGVVQLAGWVDNTDQITRAERVAASVLGVKGVQNDLRVKQ